MWKRKKAEKTETLPRNAEQLYIMARAEKDPLRKHRLLEEAVKLAPDMLNVRREILMLGELYRRDGKAPNMRLIKCYLFHIFEHPEAHSEEEQEEMARELFDAPELKACLTLSDEPENFLKEYLLELAGVYVDVFITGDKSHAPALFGFPVTRNIEDYWARPAADVIRNVFLCPFLSETEKKQTAEAFYKAFYQAVKGRTAALHENLGAEICALLA